LGKGSFAKTGEIGRNRAGVLEMEMRDGGNVRRGIRVQLTRETSAVQKKTGGSLGGGKGKRRGKG